MATTDDLIQIYASHRADDVAADADYVKLCKENDSDNVFHATRKRVELVKRAIEGEVDIQRTYRKQAKHALKLYHQLVGSEDQEDVICLRIVRLSYYPKWTDKQKNYFDDICNLIETKWDYFLSFTQRNPTGAGNPVNSYHRYLIQSVGWPDPKDSPQNELAKMLDGVLRTSRYQFRGFYFPSHEDDSAQVTKKLNEAMEKSVVFIQLVQNEMFGKRYVANQNYCFDEYSQAAKKNKRRIFLFADGQHPEDLILKEDVLFDLNDWHKCASGADPVDLEPTRVAEESQNIQANLDKLKLHLVEGVYGMREALWEGVPGDLA